MRGFDMPVQLEMPIQIGEASGRFGGRIDGKLGAAFV